MKDKLLLLFWGVLCGAVFVGAILCFGGIINWLSAHQLGVGSAPFKAGLGIVIVGAICVIGKAAGKVLAHLHIMQAARLLPPECVAAALQTPLGRAVIERREDLLEYFLDKGVRNSAVYNGMTPLHIAAALGYTDCCKILLQYGAFPSAQDRTGRTAADWAYAHGHASTAMFLDKNAEKSTSKVLK